jgi:hypothetical protein
MFLLCVGRQGTVQHRAEDIGREISLQKPTVSLQKEGPVAFPQHAIEMEKQAQLLMNEARRARRSKARANAAEQAEKSQKFSKDEVSMGSSDATTLMICDIPCRIGRNEFVSAIESLGFAGAYEFIHLPCRYGHEDANIGYGFVHFHRPQDAARFAAAFEGFKFPGFKSNKKCTVKVAKQQGFNGSLEPKTRKKTGGTKP